MGRLKEFVEDCRLYDRIVYTSHLLGLLCRHQLSLPSLPELVEVIFPHVVKLR